MLPIFNNEIMKTHYFKVILKIWVNKFKDNPRIGTIKLFTVIINCFDVEVCNSEFIDLNPVSMILRITECFEILVSIYIIQSTCI